MSEDMELFGCFVSITTGDINSTQKEVDAAAEQGKLFRSYIWSENGLASFLRSLHHDNYGVDIKAILFQFYVNPIAIEREKISAIKIYRKREKSFIIPVIIDRENFFDQSEFQRKVFLSKTLTQKVDSLSDIIAAKKLDTRFDNLKNDFVSVLTSCFGDIG